MSLLTAFMDAFWDGWNRARADAQPKPPAPSPLVLTPSESARVSNIVNRCIARERAIAGLDPKSVDQWVTYLETHNAVLVVGLPDLACIAALKPFRVH